MGETTSIECAAAGVPCFVKQLGARTVMSGVEYAANIPVGIQCKHGVDVCPKCDSQPGVHTWRDKKGGDPAEWPTDLRVRQFPEVARAA